MSGKTRNEQLRKWGEQLNELADRRDKLFSGLQYVKSVRYEVETSSSYPIGFTSIKLNRDDTLQGLAVQYIDGLDKAITNALKQVDTENHKLAETFGFKATSKEDSVPFNATKQIFAWYTNNGRCNDACDDVGGDGIGGGGGSDLYSQLFE